MPKISVPKKKLKKQPLLKEVEADVEILYPNLSVVLCANPDRPDIAGWKDVTSLTEEGAKELLGWQADGGDFGDTYLFKDRTGVKVRCSYNLKNRPYRSYLAEDWMLEILRRKWQLNAETIIIDKMGMVHDGQHRLIGLVLANQEWLIDQKRIETEQKWQKLWAEPPTMECLIVTGIDGSDAVVNTIGTGKPRDLQDVLYRCEWFINKPEKQRMLLATVTSHAVKLLWTRTAQSLVSFAPRRPHSEMLEFIEKHPRLLECVQFIMDEKVGKLKPLIGSGITAGLLYLMGSSESNPDEYDKANSSESALDWLQWEKAQEFFTDFYSEGKKTEPIREAMLDEKILPMGVGGRFALELKIALLLKGWLLFIRGKKITRQELEVETSYSGEGIPRVMEQVTCSGIDVGAVLSGSR